MKYHDRALLAEMIDERVLQTFWPARRLSSHCPTWGMGCHDTTGRVGGRIWAIHAYATRKRVLSIGVTINYRVMTPIFFQMPKDLQEWDRTISQAFCWLSRNMDEHDVRWTVPGVDDGMSAKEKTDA